MGSAEFPEKGYGYAAYFRQMSYFDTANVIHFMFKADAALVGPRDHTCYRQGELQPGPNGDYAFYYGGPGNDPAKAPLCK